MVRIGFPSNELLFKVLRDLRGHCRSCEELRRSRRNGRNVAAYNQWGNLSGPIR